MTTLFSFGLTVGISVLGIAAVQAMPLAPLGQEQAGLAIPAAGGCGPGWHRNVNGICRPNVAPGAVVVVPGAVVVAPAPCGGRGMHRVCNPYRCWRVCN